MVESLQERGLYELVDGNRNVFTACCGRIAAHKNNITPKMYEAIQEKHTQD